MKKIIPAVLFAATLASCSQEQDSKGQKVSGDRVAEQLDQAADQSDPAAKKVLEDAADAARGKPSMAPVDEPGSFAQKAMEKAGDSAAQ